MDFDEILAYKPRKGFEAEAEEAAEEAPSLGRGVKRPASEAFAAPAAQRVGGGAGVPP